MKGLSSRHELLSYLSEFEVDRAARDGYLDLLKQATKKDLNQHDEDGLTPTLWAAYDGNLDALRLCCSRGGDPDKCDYFGNTALHFASTKGYMNCLTFLVSFGANVWQMDNEYHSPMDIAGINEKTECVRYLDGVIAKQISLDNKRVKKLQEKAKKDAEQRREKYEKMMQNMRKKQTKNKTNMSDDVDSASQNWKRNSKPNSVSSSTDQGLITYSQATFNPQNKSKWSKILEKQKKAGTAASRASSDPGFKISENGRKTITSLSGFLSQQVDNVMYIRPDSMSTQNNDAQVTNGSTSKRKTIRGVFPQNMTETDRPDPSFRAFGTIALRTSYTSTNAMYDALQDAPTRVDDDDFIPAYNKPNFEYMARSMGSAGSMPGHNMAGYNDFSDDDDEDDYIEATPLDTFLASLNLTEYSGILKDEKMDMETLLMCNIDDLKEMGLPMGSRKKIMAALEERKAALHSPREMELTQF